MKRLITFFAFLALASSFAFGQTIADAAREQQAKKKAPSPTGHVYTNESMEFHAAPPDATPPSKSDTTSPSDKSAAADTKSGDTSDADDATKASDDKKKAADAIKEKYSKQQADLTQLQREL